MPGTGDWCHGSFPWGTPRKGGRMGSGQGRSVAKGSWCNAKWVYHQENTEQGCLNNGEGHGYVHGVKPETGSAYSACWYAHSSGSEPCHWKVRLPLQELNFVRGEVKVIMEDPQNWCSRNASFLWETLCWYSGGFLKELPQIVNILLKFGQQTLNCSSVRYIVPTKISPCIAAVSEELILWQNAPRWFLSAGA